MLLGCTSGATKFGKDYNSVRRTYGSPIIHDYMELKSTSEDFEHWRTPSNLVNSFEHGFHFGKGFYIHSDSTLQEDDVFRIRLNDTTFQQVNILTYGSSKSVEVNCSYLKVDSRHIELTAEQQYNERHKFPCYSKSKITQEQADSILLTWNVGRTN